MNIKQKQALDGAKKGDGIAPAKARARALVKRTLPAYGLAATILVGTASLAVAELPPVYQQCSGVEANPSAAIAACSAIIRSRHDSGHNLAVSLTNRGIGWAKENQLDRAIADLNQAVWHDPNYARAYNARGLAHFRKGNFEQAINDFDQAIRIGPRIAPAYNNRAIAYRNKHELDRALADLNQAIAINPAYALAYLNRALVWRDKGDIDRAISDLTQGLRFDPRNAAAYNHRGQLHERKGNRLLALADFRSALEIDPTQSSALAGRTRLAAPPLVANARSESDGHRSTDAPLSVTPSTSSPAITGSTTYAPSKQQAIHSTPAAATAIRPVVPGTTAPTAKNAEVTPTAVVPLPVKRPAVARSLTEALAACSKVGGTTTKVAIAIPNGKGELKLPVSYHGRQHLDCVVTALVDEATAIDRDYGEIVRANYPDLRDAKSICRIEPELLEDHIARAKTFDARAALLQKSFTANASLIEEVREALRNVDLSSQTDSAALMKSILDEISGLINRAAARQEDVLRLMQRIEASRKAMATVQGIRKAICQ